MTSLFVALLQTIYHNPRIKVKLASLVLLPILWFARSLPESLFASENKDEFMFQNWRLLIGICSILFMALLHLPATERIFSIYNDKEYVPFGIVRWVLTYAILIILRYRYQTSLFVANNLYRIGAGGGDIAITVVVIAFSLLWLLRLWQGKEHSKLFVEITMLATATAATLDGWFGIAIMVNLLLSLAETVLKLFLFNVIVIPATFAIRVVPEYMYHTASFNITYWYYFNYRVDLLCRDITPPYLGKILPFHV